MDGINPAAKNTATLQSDTTPYNSESLGPITSSNTPANPATLPRASGSTASSSVVEQVFDAKRAKIALPVIPPDVERAVVTTHMNVDATYVLGHAGSTNNQVITPKNIYDVFSLKANFLKTWSTESYNRFVTLIKTNWKLTGFTNGAFVDLIRRNCEEKTNDKLISRSYLVMSNNCQPISQDTKREIDIKMRNNHLYLAERGDSDLLPLEKDLAEFSGILKGAGVPVSDNAELGSLLAAQNLTLSKNPSEDRNNLRLLAELGLYQPGAQDAERNVNDEKIGVIKVKDACEGLDEIHRLLDQADPTLPKPEKLDFIPCSLLISRYAGEWVNKFTTLPPPTEPNFTLADNTKIQCPFMSKKLDITDYNISGSGLDKEIRIFSIPVKSEEGAPESKVIFVSNLNKSMNDEAINKINTVINKILKDQIQQDINELELFMPKIATVIRNDGHIREDLHDLGPRVLINQRCDEVTKLNVDEEGTVMTGYRHTHSALGMVRSRILSKPFGMFYCSGDKVDLIGMINDPTK